ncbi:alpha/beta hydrolase-fold protein [Flavobacterium sp.]|uniref:alpha/beta hydrolase-fold protein n=1 Tax=Flavobacterium sp. TaxID=239 RepID=UPI0026260B75|nr:alpha/beta hydrolase-fold protein [Flavobacterium sp.]
MKAIFYLLLLLPVCSFGQTQNQNDNKISIGTIETIHSTLLNEDREFLVYVPASGIGSTTRYPVMYLLDGYSFFHSATGMMQYLSAIGKMPEMIVVAIVNTDRVRDLTPTHSTLWSDGSEDANFLKNSGGGEKFISFLEKELIPYIDSTYKTEPYRLFIGHSLGGLTVINTLINHPTLFNSYVAIDPSLWWDKQSLIKKAENVLAQNDYTGRSLFFAAANIKEKGMHVETKTENNGNIPASDKLLFHKILQKSKNPSLNWNWKFYPEDNHSSVPLLSEYDAMRFLFKKYELDKELSDTTITVEYIENHYRSLSTMLQYKLLPAQSTINLLGYNFLANKQYDKAYLFFKMNIDNYPASSNVYDSMGDFYMEKNDRKNAIASFEKALSLKEVSDTRKKLEKLQTNP